MFNHLKWLSHILYLKEKRPNKLEIKIRCEAEEMHLLTLKDHFQLLIDRIDNWLLISSDTDKIMCEF